MGTAKQLQFTSPSFGARLRSMLGVDFYRLFHTPLFYIFLGIAAIIPAMVFGSSGMDASGNAVQLYTNTWQMVIFGGIMVSIFIGHDYRSGYVKQLFTTHAKKQDYMMSKSLTCAFAMACMCLTYLLGTVVSGLLMGASFEANVGSLLLAILGKMVMSLGWASRHFGGAVLLLWHRHPDHRHGRCAGKQPAPEPVSLRFLRQCVSEQQYRDPADLHRGFGGLGGHL